MIHFLFTSRFFRGVCCRLEAELGSLTVAAAAVGADQHTAKAAADQGRKRSRDDDGNTTTSSSDGAVGKNDSDSECRAPKKERYR